jgi:hypothetical protein
MISQPRRLFIEHFLLVLLAYDLHPSRLEKNIHVFESFGGFAGKYLRLCFEVAIDHGERSIEVLLLIGNKIDHWVRILKRFD